MCRLSNNDKIAQAVAGGPVLTDREMQFAAQNGLVKKQCGFTLPPVTPDMSVVVDMKTRKIEEVTIGISGTF